MTSPDATVMAEQRTGKRRTGVRASPWLVVPVLALLAAASQWLLWLFAPDPEAPEFIGPLRPEYTLNNFELRMYRDNGELSFTVEAPHMDRHSGDGHFLVSRPELLIMREGEPQWQASSDDSLIDAKGDTLQLRGGVRFHSLPDDPRPLDIRTDHLLAFPESQQVQSDVPVTIIQGRSTLNGSGLRADFAQSRMELDDFRLHAPPAR